MMSRASTSPAAMLRASRKRSGSALVAHADMAEPVEHALMEQDAVGGDEIFDQRALRRRAHAPCRRPQPPPSFASGSNAVLTLPSAGVRKRHYAMRGARRKMPASARRGHAFGGRND